MVIVADRGDWAIFVSLLSDDFTEIHDDQPEPINHEGREDNMADESVRWDVVEMSLIKEGLYIGTWTDANKFIAKAKLPCQKVRILTVDTEPLQIEEDGILTKHVPCMDEPEADLLSFFDECSEFITSGLKDKQNVIVHW